MKPNKKNIKKWVEALRSGEYYQTQGRLQREDAFCCLGVACKVFIPKSKQAITSNLELVGTTPGDGQSFAPKWLQAVDYHFSKKTDVTLVSLNDRDKFTFDEIADVLEAVFIHEVLKD